MRKPRIVVPNCPHHVIHRGNNRRRLFSYPRDYRRMLWDLSRACAKTHCRIHAICLMANHMHLIATPPTDSALGELVGSFAQGYAWYRNKDRQATGKLFEERFYSEPIKTEFHLAAATMYIDRNPVASGARKRAGDFLWSSFRVHAGDDTADRQVAGLLTPSGWLLRLGDTPAKRAEAYRATFALYSRSALARAQAEYFADRQGAGPRYTKRLERPNRSRAGEGDVPTYERADGVFARVGPEDQ